MKFNPKEYQPPIVDFIIEHQRGNVWASMGSGKSICTLTAADILLLAGSNLAPMLVLAPLRVARDVWPSECAKWDHLYSIVSSPVVGDPAERIAALNKPADLYTINYENIPWLVEQYPKKKWPFRWCIADEATRLKGFRLRKGTKRSTALSRIARDTGRWHNLTGTPAPRGLIDLWGPQYFIDFGDRLGHSFGAYQDRWFDVNVYAHTCEPKPGAQEEITELLSECTISVEVDCDKPVHMPVYFDLPYRARKEYISMENTLYAELGEDIAVEAMTAAAASSKCLQMASGAVYTDDKKNWVVTHDAKLVELEWILDELGNQPVMVSYWFVHDFVRLMKRFPHARVLKTKQDEDDWNDGKIPLLLIHPQSAGHGLNLQDGGCVIVFFSQTWNTELREQVIERIGPIRQMQSGHPRPVLVYDILARNTVDECVQERYYKNLTVQTALKRATRWRK